MYEQCLREKSKKEEEVKKEKKSHEVEDFGESPKNVTRWQTKREKRKRGSQREKREWRQNKGA